MKLNFRSNIFFLSFLLFQIANLSLADDTSIPGQFIIIEHHPAEVMKIRDVEALEEATGKQLAVTDLSKIGVKVETEAALSRTKDIDICTKLRNHQRDIRRNNPHKIVRRVQCERNQIVTADINPNDSYYSLMWDMQRMSMTSVWDKSTGSKDLIVAVIDTGVDYNHPDLAANIWTNSREIPGNGIDDDGNGYIDDLHGANFVTGSGDPMDDNGHGTHCSGTIGAKGNNGLGIAGINWNIKIMGLKFLSSSGSGSTWGAVNALTYARLMKERGENIVLTSNSWGGGAFSQALADEIERSKVSGMLFVVAAGNATNNNDTNPTYPAGYPSDNIISVAAIGSDGTLASFSNYGASTVHLAAPGVQIPSTWPNNGYVYLSGTSMACPHVSGAAALLKAYSGGLTAAQIKSALLNGASANSNLTGKTITGAELNILGAMALVPSNPFMSTPVATPTPTFTPTNTPIPTATPIPPTPTPTSTPRAGNLTLRVVSDIGVGLGQVNLSITGPSNYSFSGQTSPDGNLTISSLVGGTYTVQYSKTGYSFSSPSIQIYVNGSTTSIISAILTSYSVQGFALDKISADPISAVSVKVYVNNALTQTLVTGVDGSVTVNLPYGSDYRLAFEQNGYYPKDVSGTVTGMVKRVAAMMQ